MKLTKNILMALFVGACTLSGAVSAESGSFVAGEHYQIISPKESEEPIVEEFFNYACGACYSMEKVISEIKNENPTVKFKIIPLELRPSWKVYVKAYYIGEKLGVLDKSHEKIFRRIHVEKRHFKNDDDLKDFFVSLGVDAKAYDDVAKSYWLNTQLRLSKQYAMNAKVIGTPTLIVNKRYKLDNKKLGSGERIKQAVKELSGSNNIVKVTEQPKQ
ncbi:thiol:disulfide interchange protein DsbA/DsbL [Aliikangiella sp. IMCC44359]|uniref:thiol:disulfide interchange protein DsbA/DsbL n=1 Tax=Aliikangiella sp. IMCC44359 TaxID=3459125 RepID=UPI00403AC5CC